MVKSYAAMQRKGSLEEYFFNEESLGPNDVRIKVNSCGICHSDISAIDNDWGKSKYPMVAGHEIIGQIIEIGDSYLCMPLVIA